jgi:hypothetical protein
MVTNADAEPAPYWEAPWLTAARLAEAEAEPQPEPEDESPSARKPRRSRTAAEAAIFEATGLEIKLEP